jgi:hypothetical protein
VSPAALRSGLLARGLLSVVERHAADHFVTVDDMLGRTCQPSVVRARAGAAAELMGSPYLKSAAEVGRLLGMDRKTIAKARAVTRRAA